MGPTLRLLDAETTHNLGIWAARLGMFPKETRPDDPVLRTRVWNRDFKNPIGAERAGQLRKFSVCLQPWVAPLRAHRTFKDPYPNQAGFPGTNHMDRGSRQCAMMAPAPGLAHGVVITPNTVVLWCHDEQAWQLASTRTQRSLLRCWAWALASWKWVSARQQQRNRDVMRWGGGQRASMHSILKQEVNTRHPADS